nr:lysoplasmalogenase family protein [uncultured Anaerocolumna sp.]
MKNIKNIKKAVLITVFVLIELILYGTFMYLDIFDQKANLSMYIKFFSIFLCFLFVLLYYRTSKQTKVEKYDNTNNSYLGIHILRIAMFFTLLSDLFILVLEYYTAGILTFIIVQLLYLILISSWISSGKTIKTILMRVIGTGLITVLIVILYRFQEPEVKSELIFGIYYFILFLSNAIDAIGILFRSKRKHRILFACGLLAYFLCDINVAIFNMKDYLTINETIYSQIYNFSAIAMWMFYLPGQVAIALSGESK